MTQEALPVPERLSVLGLDIRGMLLVGDEIMTLGEWAASVLKNGVSIDELEEQRYQYRQATADIHTDAIAARSVVSKALKTFFDAGLGFEQTARYLGVSAWEVVEQSCKGSKNGGSPDVLGILCAERMLRLGAPSFAQVSRESGIPVRTVGELARRFGLVSTAAQQKRDKRSTVASSTDAGSARSATSSGCCAS